MLCQISHGEPLADEVRPRHLRRDPRASGVAQAPQSRLVESILQCMGDSFEYRIKIWLKVVQNLEIVFLSTSFLVFTLIYLVDEQKEIRIAIRTV